MAIASSLLQATLQLSSYHMVVGFIISNEKVLIRVQQENIEDQG